MRIPFRLYLALLPALALLAGAASAQVPYDPVGRSEVVPDPPAPHWLWVTDPLLRRAALVDLDSGRMLGMLSAGYGITTPLVASGRREIYVPETYYSRGSRGERTDVLSVYDRSTLAPLAEVALPPKRAMNTLPTGDATLTDDERFAVIFNSTPATSLSVVDVAERRFADEVPIPGCSLVYAAGPRRVIALCMDGALEQITLADDGSVASRQRSERFFDPEADPITEKGVRLGTSWYFVSYAGRVHEIDLSGATPRFPEPWSLVDDAERAEGWRIGGTQHLAIHARSGRLFSLMHQGGEDSHKDPGSELWVFALDRHERLARWKLSTPGVTFLGVPIEPAKDWVWPFSRLWTWLLDATVGPGIDSIDVTEDDHPLLATSATFAGGLAVYDADDGHLLRRVFSGNLTNASLRTALGSGR